VPPRALSGRSVDRSAIPAVNSANGLPIDTTGEFHNFNTDAGPPVLPQRITSTNPVFSFEWKADGRDKSWMRFTGVDEDLRERNIL